MTPSLAATTRMTMSVMEAPRARIAENAACPGVSRNVAVTCHHNTCAQRHLILGHALMGQPQG